MYSICRNLWLQRLDRKFFSLEFLELENISSLQDLSFSDPSEVEVEKYRLYQVHFLNLSEDCQKILRMFMNKRPLREIAGVMGFKTEKYAKTRKFMCKEKLRNAILNDPNCKKFTKQTMNKTKYSVLVENYVDGQLDEVQQKNFEAELLINQTLAMEFRLEKDLDRILKNEQMIDFRAKCITAQEEFNSGRLKSTRVFQLARKYWYAAAAVMLILLVVGGLFLMQPGGYSNEKLFKMYYKTGEIGISRSGNADLIQALLKYHDKDYASAVTLFDEILAKDPNNFAIRYYDGMSSIEVGNYTKAINMFKSIIDNGENLYIEYAQWYLGLTFTFINGQTDDASKIFRQIANNPDHVHQKDAQFICKKLI